MPKTKTPRSSSAMALRDNIRTVTNQAGTMTLASKQKQRIMVGDQGMAMMGKQGSVSTSDMNPPSVNAQRISDKILGQARVSQESAKYQQNMQKSRDFLSQFHNT